MIRSVKQAFFAAVASCLMVSGCSTSTVAPNIPSTSSIARSVSATTTKPTVATRPSMTTPICAVSKGEFTPARVRIDRLGIDAPVVGYGLDKHDVFMTPQGSDAYERRTVAWYKDGGLPGGSTGSVVMPAHSWIEKDSVGNRLLTARTGDIVKVLDSRGVIGACYTITSKSQVDLQGYRTLSIKQQLTMPTEGSPKLVFISCSDSTPSGEWLTRTVLIGTPLK